MSRFDAWLMMYGKKTFASLFENTNCDMLWRGRSEFKDKAKALRFQGVMRLATRFEIGKWDEICITVGRKYMPDYEFGETGMGCDRFKEIFSAQRYSKQTSPRP